MKSNYYGEISLKLQKQIIFKDTTRALKNTVLWIESLRQDDQEVKKYSNWL